jgi:hypothetical protein
VIVGQSHINPRAGLACCTPRRDVEILPEALVGLRNSPSIFREIFLLTEGEGSQRILLLATPQQGGFPSRQNP